jgi:hypothetical protein
MGVRIVAKSASYICHIRLSTRISAAPTRRVSVKFQVGKFNKNLLRKSKFWLKSDKLIRHITQRPKHVFLLLATINWRNIVVWL